MKYIILVIVGLILSVCHAEEYDRYDPYGMGKEVEKIFEKSDRDREQREQKERQQELIEIEKEQLKALEEIRDKTNPYIYDNIHRKDYH